MNEKNKVIGYILSFFFGYVFTVFLDNYGNISVCVNIFNNGKFSILVTHITVIIFGINIFRMLHGYIILLHDDNSPVYGKIINSFFQLVLLVLTFTFPLFSLVMLSKLIITVKLTTNVLGLFDIPTIQLIFILLSLPQLFYFIWDSILLSKNKQTDTIYYNYGRVWIILDAIALIALIFALFEVNSTNYYRILFIYSIICLGIIIGDYKLNKTYYFSNV